MFILDHIVKPHESDLRLDVLSLRLLVNHYPESRLSRSTLSRYIREGKILVDGRLVKPTWTLTAGSRVTASFSLETTYPHLIPNSDLVLPVIFENANFLVIDKPAGLLTHPASARDTQSVAHWFATQYPTAPTVLAAATHTLESMRAGIVHRLDADTSGLLILAKTQEAFFAFKSLFKQHLIRKTYISLVHGHLDPATGTIDLPIARAMSGNRQTIAASTLPSKGHARGALTEYRVIQRFPLYDLVEAYPQTGRTHQIRLHFYALKHPVLGDQLYFFKDYNKKLPHQPARHLLHATRLEFDFQGHRYTFDSPLPSDFTPYMHETPAQEVSPLTEG